MNQVKCDLETKIVRVGGGALWQQVDDETIKYGLATVGGTVSHVSDLFCRPVVGSTTT